MLGVFVVLQRAGRCIDTYQAIWGLDPSLPGNRRRPIGLGIVRLRAQLAGAPPKTNTWGGAGAIQFDNGRTQF